MTAAVKVPVIVCKTFPAESNIDPVMVPTAVKTPFVLVKFVMLRTPLNVEPVGTACPLRVPPDNVPLAAPCASALAADFPLVAATASGGTMTQNVNAIATKTARTCVRSLGSGAFIDFLHISIVPAPEAAFTTVLRASASWDGEGSGRDGR